MNLQGKFLHVNIFIFMIGIVISSFYHQHFINFKIIMFKLIFLKTQIKNKKFKKLKKKKKKKKTGLKRKLEKIKG